MAGMGRKTALILTVSYLKIIRPNSATLADETSSLQYVDPWTKQHVLDTCTAYTQNLTRVKNGCTFSVHYKAIKLY